MARKTVTIPIPERAEKLVTGAEKALGNLGTVGRTFLGAVEAFRDPVRGIVEGIREAREGVRDAFPSRQADRIGPCPACGGGELERKFGGHGDRLYCTNCCATFPDGNAARPDSAEDRHPNERRGDPSRTRIEDDE